MEVEIYLEDMNSACQEPIDRELNLRLASVRHLLKRVRAEVTQRSIDGAGVRCRIELVMRSGEVLSTQLDGVDLMACVSAGAARVRRSVYRTLRYGEPHQLASGVG